MESCKLPDVPLFRGLTETETAVAIEALRMRRRPFAKGEVLLEAGCTAPPLGVVLAGRVHMEHLDVWGSKTLLGQAGRSVCRDLRLPARGTASGQRGGSRKRRGAAFGHRSTMRCGCEPWRWKMTQNLLRIAARKNLGLAQRSLYTAPKTIRGRITAYFSVLARRSGSMQFNLPFDRQQLADHLGVDRSALSNALSQMQREGLLTLDRRKVELRQVDEL